jgi:hypothetical protein
MDYSQTTIQTNHGGTPGRGDLGAVAEAFDRIAAMRADDNGMVGAQGAPYSNPVLNERETTHGDYKVTAIISQYLKRFFREQMGWENLSEPQRESFDSIAVKMARILSGNPNEADHWTDIKGYVDLIVSRLK